MAAKTIKKEGTVRIAHFGAYDLESLGDTMFPVIFRLEMEERFGDRLEIDLYAPSGTDHPYNHLTRVYQIDALAQRHAKDPYCALVIGGGEFIHFQPVNYLSPDGKATQYSVGELWKKPQEIAKTLDLAVIWNGVGAGRDFENISEMEQVRQACESLSYLSVRDAYSRMRLQQIAVTRSIYQVPDMLWLFRRHIQPETLDACFAQLKREYRFLNQDYLVLQYGTSLEYQKLAEEVQKISADYGLAVLLLTVNYCHEDQQSCLKIQEVCQEFYIVGRKLQPKEIMSVISHAKFFLGTSLHGNITAMSYGVKNLCLDMYPSCVGKMDGLFAMMQMEELMVRDISSLRGQFDQQMQMENREIIAEKAALFQEELKCHFDRIAGLLKENADQKKKAAASGAEAKPEQIKMLQTFKRCRLIKSVLNNGNLSIGCSSMMEFDHAKKGSQSLELEFQIQKAAEVYQGKFYYPNPFLVESMKADENGKPVRCSLKGMVAGGASADAVYKDCCTFLIDSNQVESGKNQVLVKVHLRLRDAWQEYVEALEGQAQSDARELLNRQGHIELLLASERKLTAESQEKQKQVGELLKEEQSLQRELEKKQEYEETLKHDLKRKQKRLETYAKEEQKQKRELKSKQEHLEVYAREEQKLKQELLNKQGHIELLLESEREFERVKKSRTWRLAFGMQQLSAHIVPPGSVRRLLVKLLLKFARHPISFVKKLTPARIRNFYRFYRQEGSAFVSRRVDLSMPEAAYGDTKPLVELRMQKKDFSEYAPLVFPEVNDPDVSIIIPVYNQFAYTYNCLKSILEQTGSTVRYEVILADDCSTDDTKRLLELVKNIKVIRNQKNLLFLRNCNHAAASARGRYLLFLNNDTQVQENWLEPLMRLLKQNPFIGMTGSKLIYPDGRLQEAGGIIWNDGSAWNYGNRQEADRPEFNYVKEVDYISGASLMIRKKLWQEIGGFDERYAPAYCEDSDLAFEVRKRGYFVVYQPQSVVVHFEGISNGKDENRRKNKTVQPKQNIKQYQAENSKKLRDKWSDVLKEHYPNAHHVFRARERSKGKPVILFIDHYIPQYDKDAGSKTVYQYLKLFVKKGFQVKFIGDNFYRQEPYASKLEQMGIEVLYGGYYQSHIFQWLDRNHQEIDFVFLNRPHISIKYIDYFYNKTNVNIIYYGHDLHYLRNLREYRLTKDAAKLREAKAWKKKEMYLLEKANVSYYPSSVEIEEIHKLNANIRVKAVTAYAFDSWLKDLEMDFSKREGILFVGGFVHEPNIDAVRWFVKEIYPKIRGKCQMPFYIVGSNATKEIVQLDGRNGICVKGYLTEEELHKLYQSCRIAVVPLRYGAGVKGKVVEAVYQGVPVVTTSVGAEGILQAEEVMKIKDQPQAFADEVLRLYNDCKGLEKMAERSQVFIKKYFSMDAVWEGIAEDFSVEMP